MRQKNIVVLTNQQVARIEPVRVNNRLKWRLSDQAGQTLTETPLVILAAGYASGKLMQTASPAQEGTIDFPLQAIRGQVAWGRRQPEYKKSPAWPPFPVNGRGNFIPAFWHHNDLYWMAGATFARGDIDTQARDVDRLANWNDLRALLPKTAAALEANFYGEEVQSWTGVRCALADHFPAVGPISPQQSPGLWVCTAMGSRGLTMAVLCGELIAGLLHREPLPIEKRLLKLLLASRFNPDF